MPTIFSKPMGYALRAMIHLARHGTETPVLTADIAEAEDIPVSYLGKVLGRLTLAGMVSSTRGPKGGYLLEQDPATISLADLYDLFETQSMARECLLGFKQCPGPKYCALHKRWLEPQRHIESFLNNTRLADLLEDDRRRRDSLLDTHRSRRAEPTAVNGSQTND